MWTPEHRRYARHCRKLGARGTGGVQGFGDLRNRAIEACTHEWIFSLDADERCTPAVERELRAVTQSADALDAYWMPRRNYFMGRWIRYSGWYPNYRQPQLFRKGRMAYDNKPVHEGYVLQSDKPIGHLQNAIWQFPFRTWPRSCTRPTGTLPGRREDQGQAHHHGFPCVGPWNLGL